MLTEVHVSFESLAIPSPRCRYCSAERIRSQPVQYLVDPNPRSKSEQNSYSSHVGPAPGLLHDAELYVRTIAEDHGST